MNIEKRTSGSYRVRKMVNGKQISLTFDHKPSEKEILLAFTNKMQEQEAKDNDNLTFRQAASKYVDAKRNVLSVTTVREYSRTCDRLSEWFCGMRVADITQVHINRQVNELSVGRSPKTVRNYHGFISAILGTYKPEMNISTTLPQKRKEEAYIPTTEDVRKILEHERDTIFYVPYVLACHGLRRGEILAVESSDLDGDVLHVNKSLAMDQDGKWVHKSTKTTASTRDIIIPMDVADMIRKQGFAYRGSPCYLSEHLNNVQRELGIPRFSLHKLRHYFASVMSASGVADVDIMALGGWETDYVMKNVYRHSMIEQEAKRKRDAMSKLQSFIF